MDTFDSVKEEAVKAVEEAKDLSGLQEARITWLGKKGKIQGLMAEMKNLPKEEKPAFGQKVNGLKKTVSELIEERQKVQESINAQKQKDFELYHGSFSRSVFRADDIRLLQGVQQR